MYLYCASSHHTAYTGQWIYNSYIHGKVVVHGEVRHHIAPDEDGLWQVRPVHTEIYIRADGSQGDPSRWAADCCLTNIRYANNWQPDARTSHTYVLSPDPADNATVDELLELGREFCGTFLGGFPALLCVHAERTPHVHIVIGTIRSEDAPVREWMSKADGTVPAAYYAVGYKHSSDRYWLYAARKWLYGECLERGWEAWDPDSRRTPQGSQFAREAAEDMLRDAAAQSCTMEELYRIVEASGWRLTLRGVNGVPVIRRADWAPGTEIALGDLDVSLAQLQRQMEENYERKRRAREAWEREQERIAEAKEREKRNREYEAQTRYERVVYVQPYTADGRRRSLLEQLRLEAKADSLPPDSLEVCVVYRPINPRETVINARPAVRLQAELDAISFCSAEGVWGLEALQRLTRTCKADMQRARRRLERIEVDRRSWECLLEALQERDKYVQIAKPILEMQDGPEKDRLCRQHPIEVDHYTQAVLALQGHEGLQCSEASARIAENKAAAAKAQEEYEGSLKRYRGARNARNCEARRLYSPEQPTAQREHYGRPHRTTGDEFFCEYQRRYDLFLERLKEAAAQR